MALESATYVNQLNPSYPTSTDPLSQGDDHLRLIKAVLQATFPNITGPMTLTQAQLNGVLGTISGAGVPTGIITAWYGASGAVPAGWHVCDGTTGIARSDGTGTIDVPDLRNLVLMGAGTVAPQGTAYGGANSSATTATAGAHSHATTAGEGGHAHSGVTVAGHALAISEIPAHSHTVPCGTSEGDNAANFTNGNNSVGTPVATNSIGAGAAHGHDMSWPVTPDGTHTHTTDTVAAHAHGVTVSTYQPALALHYIMKV